MAKDAQVIGDVTLGDDVSVFFGSVIRGDILPITLGCRSNIQEHSLLHTSHNRTPTIIGDDVTVGHRAIIHGAMVGNRVLVGMGATLLDEAVIEDDCIIGAGTLITEGKRIPSGSLVLGSPGRIIRELTDKERAYLLESASGYVETGRMFKDGGF